MFYQHIEIWFTYIQLYKVFANFITLFLLSRTNFAHVFFSSHVNLCRKFKCSYFPPYSYYLTHFFLYIYKTKNTSQSAIPTCKHKLNYSHILIKNSWLVIGQILCASKFLIITVQIWSSRHSCNFPSGSSVCVWPCSAGWDPSWHISRSLRVSLTALLLPTRIQIYLNYLPDPQSANYHKTLPTNVGGVSAN